MIVVMIVVIRVVVIVENKGNRANGISVPPGQVSNTFYR